MLPLIGKGPVQFVICGNYVFNLRGEPGFLESNGLNQRGLVRNKLTGSFQLGQGLVGFDGLFEHGPGFQLNRRRQ
jgi:hypothetical protein